MSNKKATRCAALVKAERRIRKLMKENERCGEYSAAILAESQYIEYLKKDCQSCKRLGQSDE